MRRSTAFRLALAIVVVGLLPVVSSAQGICGAPNPGKTTRSTTGGGFRLTGDVNRRWKDRERITVRLYGASRSLHDMVVDDAGDWTRFANLYLDFGTHRNADIRVYFNQNGGHWSQVGTDAKSVARGRATMNLAINSRTSRREIRRVVLHEFGHALGFVHEHQNPKGGIKWNKPKVYAYFRKTQGWDKNKVDLNIFREYSRDSVNASRFDKSSIMLYSIPRELTTNGFSSGSNTRLSQLDKRHAARLYPWTPHSLVRVRNGTKTAVSFQYKWDGAKTWRRLTSSNGRLKAGGTNDLWKNAGKNANYKDLIVRFNNGKGKTSQFRLAAARFRPRRTGDYPDFSRANSFVFRFRNGALTILREKR